MAKTTTKTPADDTSAAVPVAAPAADDPQLHVANIGPEPEPETDDNLPTADDVRGILPGGIDASAAPPADVVSAGPAADDPLAPGKTPTLGEILAEEARRAGLVA
ncbi:MAG: hypothetical protein ACRDBL_11285 [Rhabdaerophilum sp.]